MKWINPNEVILKLKKAEKSILNKVYPTLSPLPEDLKILDEEGDSIEDISFESISTSDSSYSVLYEKHRYYLEQIIPLGKQLFF